MKLINNIVKSVKNVKSKYNKKILFLIAQCALIIALFYLIKNQDNCKNNKNLYYYGDTKSCDQECPKPEVNCPWEDFDLKIENLDSIKLYEIQSPYMGFNEVTKYKLRGGKCYFSINLYNRGWPTSFTLNDSIENVDNTCELDFFKFLGIDKFSFIKDNTLYIVGKDELGEMYTKNYTYGGDKEKISYVNNSVDRVVSSEYPYVLKGVYSLDGKLLIDLGQQRTREFERLSFFLDLINEGIVIIKDYYDYDEGFSNAEISYLDLNSLKFKKLDTKKYKLNSRGVGCAGDYVEFYESKIIVTLGGCITHSTDDILTFEL